MAECFGSWLVSQKSRRDWIGQLAEAAARDPRFPKQADPDGVRMHIGKAGADPDMFDMLDDAEGEWLAIN